MRSASERPLLFGGTEGSNLASSSAESGTNRRPAGLAHRSPATDMRLGNNQLHPNPLSLRLQFLISGVRRDHLLLDADNRDRGTGFSGRVARRANRSASRRGNLCSAGRPIIPAPHCRQHPPQCLLVDAAIDAHSKPQPADRPRLPDAQNEALIGKRKRLAVAAPTRRIVEIIGPAGMCLTRAADQCRAGNSRIRRSGKCCSAELVRSG
jgi:hypothetical protein